MTTISEYYNVTHKLNNYLTVLVKYINLFSITFEKSG